MKSPKSKSRAGRFGSRKSKRRSGPRKSKSRSATQVKSRTRVGSRKSKRRSGPRKSKSRFGSKSPTSSKLKLEHLPNDVLQLVYDKIPRGKDRVALASTSRRMNSVPYAYESATHVIRKPAANSAQRVTFKKAATVQQKTVQH